VLEQRTNDPVSGSLVHGIKSSRRGFHNDILS
jgi:hypothetical protein